MNPKNDAPSAPDTQVVRASDCDLLVTRRVDAPACRVFEAWTRPEMFARWWVPKSAGMRLLSCEMDVRVGGRYALEFSHPAFAQPMIFFGTYLDVVPHMRLAWTNEESEDGPITRVAFEEHGGHTLVVLRDCYPTKAALDAALASGSTSGWPEQFQQLDELLCQAR